MPADTVKKCKIERMAVRILGRFPVEARTRPRLVADWGRWGHEEGTPPVLHARAKDTMRTSPGCPPDRLAATAHGREPGASSARLASGRPRLAPTRLGFSATLGMNAPATRQ